jgi:hypothetical protein
MPVTTGDARKSCRVRHSGTIPVLPLPGSNRRPVAPAELCHSSSP